MYRQDLTGRWEFREVGEDEWQEATVPGGVYTDLLAADEISDPLVADNELDVQWVAETDWEYRRTVTVDPEVLAHDRILLSCEGLDTVATVFVNGREVGSSVNMHVGHEFEVGDALHAGENELRVVFRSPVEYGRQQASEYPHDVPYIHYPIEQPARPFVRKAQCHYGWDWGPCLPTMGIYRDISLLAHSGPRMSYVTTEQNHSEAGVNLTVRAGVDAPSAGVYDLTASVAESEQTEAISIPSGKSTVELTIGVEDPDLWWPNGYGDQPLYDLEVTIAGRSSHTVTDRVGFRDLEVVVEADEAGTGFHIEVNDVPVFAKGANTIPVAPLYGKVTEDRYEHLIRSAADANMNTLRVWGGGYYEDEAFYELCDEYGILVWQDFMFSCALYPADEAFLETVESEVRHQVRRLANHPSIALWCGNNENEEALYKWFVRHPDHEAHLKDYEALYADTVEPTCREEDPSRTFWQGSPSSGPDENDPDIESKGDTHYWEVWHAGQPFEDYYTTEPRFVSEFGYQSFPSIDSLRTVLEESDLNPSAPLMEHHQRSPDGNATILKRMADYFRIPFGFSDFIYLSQVQQGLAMQTAIEHWRRRKPATMGALYWQLNDLWPVASWASIEYDGKWKAQQYMARRQYAPVLVSFHPTYEGDGGRAKQQGAEDDQSKRDGATSLSVWLTSDLPRSIGGAVTFTVERLAEGAPIVERNIDVSLEGGASEELLSFARSDLPETVDASEVMLRATYDGPGESYAGVAFFEDYKSLSLPEVDLSVEVEGTDITVSGGGGALFVELDPGTLAGAFSDNYFHLPAGGERTVTFESHEGRPDQTVETVLERDLSVRHLRDTY